MQRERTNKMEESMTDSIDIYQKAAPMASYDKLSSGVSEALQVVNDIVLKNYISNLTQMDVIPLDPRVIEMNTKENVRFFKITEMVYEKEEFSSYKFASVFNALSTADCAIFILIDSDGEKTDFYMGVRSLDSDRTTSSLKNTLQNALKGQFPGIKTKDYMEEEISSILSRIKGNSVSTVSCVADSKDIDNRSNGAFVQGLEKLVLSMQGEKYTGIILANGTKQQQLLEIRREYEKIYTQLSPFASSQINYANNSAVNISDSLSFGTSKGTTHTDTQSMTNGMSRTENTSSTSGISNEGTGSKVVKGIASAASLLGAALTVPFGGLSMAIGGMVSGGLGMLGTAITKTESYSTTQGNSFTQSESKQTGSSDSYSNTQTESTAQTKGISTGLTQGVTLNRQDKSIVDILERIDMQLKRLQEFESLGMYECAAYFLSENQYAAEIAASTYKAIMKGENSGVEVAAVNSWRNYDGNKTKLIAQYATNFIHPVFRYQAPTGSIEVTPCSLVSGSELAIHMGLPRRSVCGFPVIEHANFGKEVVSYHGNTPISALNLGRVFHMGSECTNSVRLDKNSLSMHTFITGSTGSGKSNTVYEILRQLGAVGVKFMIVEPAKGEYKNVFGRQKDVMVLGTNPHYARMLKINPFKFPPNIHILEHIDRLVEIFNVCWPMYAAMPAVLKDALLQSYEVCGWDLVQSRNTYSEDFFPTFRDLLSELQTVIHNSAYSEEVKSNYIGSLVTRVRSLTNGLNGQIFSAKEIDNAELFDSNVIIDLSRVGSMETKSLIMGILVMRLSEHRMSHAAGMNQPLQHVTVLEEAHNILRRTSSEQNPEASSVSGKSVEMISNAIAEMRTYGEGFIIADQSPSAVDISAIRNTNTKIIMRLPDEADRRMAGKAAALKDEQLDEIAKLPKGVAVVYQNDWVEPVLCKICKFGGEETPYEFKGEETVDRTDSFKRQYLEFLLSTRVTEHVDTDMERLTALLDEADISSRGKIHIRELLKTYERNQTLYLWEDEKFAALAEHVSQLLDSDIFVKNAVRSSESFNTLTEKLFQFIEEQTGERSREFKLAISQCLLRNKVSCDETNREIYAGWITDMKKGVDSCF